VIFHLVDAASWSRALEKGEHRPASVDLEGFVHLSTVAQVVATANRFFKGRTDLLLLHVDDAQLPSGLKYEEGEPGELFPHFYGPLPLTAVTKAAPFPCGSDGAFSESSLT